MNNNETRRVHDFKFHRKRGAPAAPAYRWGLDGQAAGRFARKLVQAAGRFARKLVR
jgi:hypothetical protein